MFEALSDKLQGIFRSLRGQGTLSEAHVDAALREIRLALLEADVHFKVVKQFLEKVRAKAIGQEVLKSLSPDQAVLRIVRDEMVDLLGGEEPRPLQLANRIPSVVLMTGLQGSGKTTTSAKLGRFLKQAGKHPLLVSTDVYRPAAREQLKTVGEKAGLKVHHPASGDPRELLRSALAEARAIGHDVLVVDTAGRLHVDEELMAELAALKALAEPTEILYVADAMTGQDAVTSALAFHEKVGITGIVLTKLDGDARGGAALSAAAVTGCPVKFAGLGEKVESFEAFAPGRMVGRILGMGDVLGLIERVEESVDRDQAEAMVRKLRRSEFTLEDYRDQIRQMRRLGKLDEVLAMIPGVKGAMKGVDVDQGEREMTRAAAIIDSMTKVERRDPTVINGSRRKRIAKGSGTRVEDVNRLLRNFVQTRKAMKQMMGMGGGMKAMKRMAARMPQFGR
ncbi:MAG TPA: signal recognition particle protein [Vicinamibacteria bacterium]|nr:signal recognition particle protein [Vicinamibacteria bacterium]